MSAPAPGTVFPARFFYVTSNVVPWSYGTSMMEAVLVAGSWITGPVVGMVWATLFVLVAIVHVAHMAVMSGRHRLWHGAHVLMAAGMVIMSWPGGMRLVPARVAVAVYSLAAGTLAVVLVVAQLRRARLGPLWLANVVDLAAMAYMFAMMTTRLAWLSALGVVWFSVQSVSRPPTRSRTPPAAAPHLRFPASPASGKPGEAQVGLGGPARI